MTDGGDAWWRTAVVYEVYLRSFADSDGDGTGDVNGLRSRLPYLAGLGVDAIWITPWYVSPMVDGGYDVADHRAIASEFGTLADAELLIAEAHELGVRVLLDLVPNHTSDQHPWFRAALAGGPERDRYWFCPGRGPDGRRPPNNWRSTQGGPAWHRAGDGDWYLHLFAPEQPDLNWSHPAVAEEFDDILRFWFDRGVDGFRIDVAHGIEKDPTLPDLPGTAPDGAGPDAAELAAGAVVDHPHWDRDGIVAVFRRWRAIADSYRDTPQGPRVFVAEAWRIRPDGLARYLAPGLLHTAFNFDYLDTAWDAAALRASIERHLRLLEPSGAPATWVLSTHDLTRHVTRYATGSPGRRTAEDVATGRRRARAAALLTLALPGSAYLYQGEELGLEDVEDLPEEVLQDPIWHRSGHSERGRDGRRVPLPWTAGGPSLGFGSGTPWLPQPAGWSALAAAVQETDATSVLALYRDALAMRRGRPDLRTEPLTWRTGAPDVVAFDRGDHFRCFVNLGREHLPAPAGFRPVLGSVHLGGDGELPGDAAAWYVRDRQP